MPVTIKNSYVEVDLAKVKKNARSVISELAEGVSLIPVLKDNAYGLGLLPIAHCLEDLPEVKMVAVANVSEGVELRESGFAKDILIMGGTAGYLLPYVLQHDLTLAVGRPGLAAELAVLAQEAGKSAKVHVKIETGLNRMGFFPGENLDELIGELQEAGKNLTVTGAFSHFADPSDEKRSNEQLDLLLSAVEQLEHAGISVPLRHISGSEAFELRPEDQLDAVRLGRRLYMDHPTAPTGKIEEVCSWRTFVTRVHRIPKGGQMGYSGKCIADHDLMAATIAVGYGDGLNAAMAQHHAPVLIGGKRAKVLCCCMDQSIVDVTDIPCAPDDEVTLFGYDSQGGFLSSQEVALLIDGNEGCGLTSDLSPRVERIYKK